MFPTLQLGPVSIQAPGLFWLVGLWLGLTLAEKQAARHQSEASHLYNLVFYGLMAAIIGARLSYAAQYLDSFLANPLSLLSLNPALLDPAGGLLVGLLVAFVYGNRKQLALWSTLDALTPLLAVMAVAMGLSHLAAGDAFGRPTTLPWGIELWGARRHPTQIYQIILALLILWQVLRPWWRAVSAVTGRVFLQFTALTAAATILNETLRGDSLLLANGLRVTQLIAFVILAGSLWMVSKRSPGKAQSKKATFDSKTGETSDE
ncbi:MAG: prolipoprotein diacylglyceryl transferase [Anaerolineales bacterium]|nr:prolipoprotein diacylglyceryl transferase [Anaerolineales bacterium]